jgi:Fungal N-terminal domain of STAND proteins
MDPLSIIASALTILEVGTKVSKGLSEIINTWNGAPPAILALYNEISDLNVVLDHVSDAQRTVKANGAKFDTQFLEALDEHLYQARQLLSQLETLVRELKDLSSVKKKYKWLFKNSEATNLQHRIREVRSRINDLLVAYNV